MLNKKRIEAFNDAILAIIMTIMVLDIKIPTGPNFQSLSQIFIPLIAFFISFFSLVDLWLGHHEACQPLLTKVRGL